MADLREVFPILRDDSTGAGEEPVSRIEGEAAAGKEGLIGFSFKDSSGNVVLPQLNAAGKILVDVDGGIAYKAKGELAAGSLSLAVVTGAVLTLVLNKAYRQISVTGCSLRSSLFQLIYIDDAAGTPVESVIAEFIVGPGQFSHSVNFGEGFELDTSAGTGVQKLEVKAKNFDHASSLRATVSAFQTSP